MRLCKALLSPRITAGGNTENKSGLLSTHQCAFIVHTLSWSMSYMLPRTLGNSLETCLLVIGTSMLFAPSQREAARDTEYVSSAAVLLASVSVYSRPTAVLLWVSVLFLKCSVCSWSSIHKLFSSIAFLLPRYPSFSLRAALCEIRCGHSSER